MSHQSQSRRTGAQTAQHDPLTDQEIAEIIAKVSGLLVPKDGEQPGSRPELKQAIKPLDELRHAKGTSSTVLFLLAIVDEILQIGSPAGQRHGLAALRRRARIAPNHNGFIEADMKQLRYDSLRARRDNAMIKPELRGFYDLAADQAAKDLPGG